MGLHNESGVVLLIGAPGSGKGTQARFLAELLAIPHVSSGDLLREHRKAGTDLGTIAQLYMDRGELVPDDVVIGMILARLDQQDARRGVLLDGFPRTPGQARALDVRLAERKTGVRRALYFAVSDDSLVERLSGRWLCESCQTPYHSIFSPSPAGPTTCGVDGGLLYQRPDDRREVVAQRLVVYMRDTSPVIKHYRAEGVLREINADHSIDDVRRSLEAVFAGQTVEALATS